MRSLFKPEFSIRETFKKPTIAKQNQFIPTEVV